LVSNVVGGLISAYSLTGDRLYLSKAVECGEVALTAFTPGPIPKAVVHGLNKIAPDLPWAFGIPLSDAGSFPLELRALSLITSDSKYLTPIESFFTTVKNHIENSEALPLFLKGYGNATIHMGLSPLNVGFMANVLRMHISSPTPASQELLDLLLRLVDQTSLQDLIRVVNGTVSRFDSSFCQLVPLLNTLDQGRQPFTQQLLDTCRLLASEKLPYEGASITASGVIVDEDGFNFDAGLIENALLKTGNVSQLSFLGNITEADCGGAVCGFLAQRSGIRHNLVPPVALSKWLKLLLLDGIGLNYSGYVLNEAGHIIPTDNL
jgi:hypothetical protein